VEAWRPRGASVPDAIQAVSATRRANHGDEVGRPRVVIQSRCYCGLTAWLMVSSSLMAQHVKPHPGADRFTMCTGGLAGMSPEGADLGQQAKTKRTGYMCWKRASTVTLERLMCSGCSQDYVQTATRPAGMGKHAAVAKSRALTNRLMLVRLASHRRASLSTRSSRRWAPQVEQS
jgi:hypothetical protein